MNSYQNSYYSNEYMKLESGSMHDFPGQNHLLKGGQMAPLQQAQPNMQQPGNVRNFMSYSDVKHSSYGPYASMNSGTTFLIAPFPTKNESISAKPNRGKCRTSCSIF